MDRRIEVKVFGNHLWKDGNRAGVQGEGNVTTLRISFDEGWSGYAKSITFFDAKGRNPVQRMLTVDLLEDITQSALVYLCKIPPEPLTEAGRCSFVIEGYVDEQRQRVVETELEVAPARETTGASDPGAPTPTQAEQLQAQIEAVMEDVQKAAEGAQNAELAGQYASEARASAESALESKETAVTSAASASESAVRAEKALSQMGNNAAEAAASAAAAKAAQTAAEQSASDAQQSADAAASVAADIKDSVDAAAASAAQAKESAQGVATHVAAAQASASAAKTSETNAASSASKAKTSETNAASSASSAESSKSSAESAATRAETAKAAAESAKQEVVSSVSDAAESARLAGLKAEEAKSNASLAQNHTVEAFNHMSSARDSASAASVAQVAAEAAKTAAERAASEAQQAAGGDFATPAYVTGQISTHNTAEDAHADIRERAEWAIQNAMNAYEHADTKAHFFYCYLDETSFDEVNDEYTSGRIVVLWDNYELWPLVYAEEGYEFRFRIVDPDGIRTAYLTEEGWSNSYDEFSTGGSAYSIARIGWVDLPASAWVSEGSLHSQVVEIEGVTECSQVDLTPSVEQLAVFYEKDLTFVTENEDGVVTVYAIGQKPTNDYTIQVTITEVEV